MSKDQRNKIECRIEDLEQALINHERALRNLDKARAMLSGELAKLESSDAK